MHNLNNVRMGNAGSHGCRCPASVGRIFREYQEIRRQPSQYWHTAPMQEEEPYDWHFTLRGPESTEFAGGLYHGRIVLPVDYPFSAPNVILLTPNGRFEVGKKVCLSASSYHPELWQPAWGLRTLLDALSVFFCTPSDGAVGGLDSPFEIRKELAMQSQKWTCSVCKASNESLIQFADLPTSSAPVPVAGQLALVALRNPGKEDLGTESSETNTLSEKGASSETERIPTSTVKSESEEQTSTCVESVVPPEIPNNASSHAPTPMPLGSLPSEVQPVQPAHHRFDLTDMIDVLICICALMLIAFLWQSWFSSSFLEQLLRSPVVDVATSDGDYHAML